MTTPGGKARRWAFWLRLVLALSILLQLAGSPAATASSAAPTAMPALPAVALSTALSSTLLPVASWVRNVVLSVAGQQATVPATANVVLSTPWTAFVGGVNVVQGNVSVAQADLAVPSIGIATAVGRSYNGAAADVSGPFGYGWFWSYGVRVIPQATAAVVVREDGRADTFSLSGSTYTAPPGIFDQLVKNPDNTFTLTRRDQVRYELSATGVLQRIVDPNGNTLTVSYAGSAPSGLTDTAGRTWAIQTDGSGRITRITDPAARAVLYEYNVAGDLVKVTDPLGGTVQFAYDASHHLTTLTDQNGHTRAYAYDGSSRATSVTDGAGNATTVSYDTGTRRTTFTDPLSHATVYAFDALSRVTGITDAANKTETWAWSAANTRTSVTDRNGGVTTSTYDSRGNVLDLGDAAGGHVVSTYDAANRPLTRRNQNGHTTTFTYDAAGNLTSTTDPAGNATTHAYDAKGQRTSTTNANNKTSTFGYDANGNRTSATDPLSHQTSWSYDAAGRVLGETDPDGRTTTRAYDALGRALSVTDGAGGTSHATYDGVGNRLTATDARGKVTRYEYDARNLLLKVTDADNNVSRLEYDAAGNKTAAVDALGKRTTFAYDALNRLTQATDPNNSVVTYVYDNVGNQTRVTDPNNHATSFQYDALNRLTQVTDPLGGRAQYGYDGVGNRTSVTDPNGHGSQISYDNLNRPVSMVDPLTHALTYVYDGVGNLLQKTDGNHATTTYQYDAANRLTQANYPEGAVSYAYDGAGNRTSMTDQTGTTTYQYDGARRLTRNTAPNGQVSYTYDANGNVTRVANPGGNDVTYQYDDLSRLIGVTDWNGLTSGYDYDAVGRRIGASQPNGTRATYAYDNGSRLTNIRWTGPGGASIVGITYTYDAAGNRTKVVDGGGQSTYSYDSLDRLTHAAYPDGRVVDYEYDPAGNRTKMIDAGQTTFYTYDSANRLQSIGATQVTWDNNGNMLSNGTTTYRWDSQNRLLESKTGDQVNAQMAYDGANRRVSRLANGQANQYVYDEHGDLARVVKESNLQRSQTYGLNGQPVFDATSDQGQLYYHQDAIGSTVALTKSDGSLAGTRQYDAFGAPRNAVGTMPGSFWFAGEQYDPETGLIYLRARYYDPATGRFLSTDPVIGDIKNTQTLNPYAYAKNNPLRYTDPKGEFSLDDASAFLGEYKTAVVAVGAVALVGCVVVTLGGCGLIAAAAAGATAIVSTAKFGVDTARYFTAEDNAKQEQARQEAISGGFEAIVDLASFGASAGLTSGPRFFGDRRLFDNRYGVVKDLKRVIDIYKDKDEYAEAFERGVNIGKSIGEYLFGSQGDVLGASTGPNSASPGYVYQQQPAKIGLSSAQIQQMTRTNEGRRQLMQLGVPGGAFVSLGQPPRQPTNTAPYNWFLTVGDAPTLQWSRGGSPDGHTIVASKVRVYRPGSNDIYHEGPWITGTSYKPTGLPYGTFSWVAIDMDDRGLVSAESDRWNFSIDSPFITYTDFSFTPTSPSNAEDVTIHVCTNGQAGVGITMRVSVNDATDGSANGTWHVIKELGVPCFNAIDAPVWHTLDYADGDHLVRAEAHGSQEGWAGEVTQDAHYVLTHRRPAGPQLVGPKDGTFSNTRDVTFQWNRAVNATSYRLRAATTSDPTASPVIDVTLDPATLQTSTVNGFTTYSYPVTLAADYPALTWMVTAIDDVGSTDSGHFVLGVDRVPATSHVTPLSATSAQDVFLVRWASTDDRSGVDCTNVEVREGADGIWTDWFGCTKLGFSLFQGQDGVTYYFRARARDVAGNFGDFANAADGDASITVNVALANVWWNGQYLSRRQISVLNSYNGELPAGYPVRLRLDGSTTPRAVDVFDSSQTATRCDDLRVLFGDATELDRLVLTCTSSTIDILFRIHVAIPATTLDGTNYALYYSNAAAGAPPADRNDVLYPPIDGNTLRAYDMLDGSGLSLRDASLHNDGSMNSALGWDRQGKFGPAVVVPGDQPTGSAIDGGASILPASAFTVEFWLKRVATYGASLASQTVDGYNPRWSFELDDRLRLVVWPWPGAGSADVHGLANLNDQSFYTRFRHIAVTFDGANVVRFYVDGRLDAARTLSQSGLVSSASPLRIAAGGNNASRLGGSLSGFYLSSGVRTDFSYAQFADVTVEPTVTAGPEQILTNPLPTATPTSTPGATPTVGPGAVDGGTGANGPLTIVDAQTLNNFPTTATGSANTVTLTVGDSSGHQAGNEILIHQTRGAGLWEYARIQSVSGTTLTLTGPLAHNYNAGAQVVRVPNYTDVMIQSGGSLQAAAWDGTSGGLLAFRANGTVRVQSGGRLDVSGLGYRGGAPRTTGCGQGAMAQQGEGSTGVGANSNSRNGNGGGGGQQTAVDGGGGGGAYGTIGQSSQWGSAEGGAVIGNGDLTTVFFGGGGGGATCTGGSPGGSPGGGALMIVAPTIVVETNGSILAHGLAGQASGSAGAGGGAGGAILLRAGVLDLGNQRVQAMGGPGGGGGSSGGSGGDGRIRLEAVQLSGSTAPAASVGSVTAPVGTSTATPTVTPTVTGSTVSGWVAQTSGATGYLNSVSAVSATTAWIAGNSGTILKTTNGGVTWVPQTSGTTADLLSVAAVDANTAWVVGTTSNDSVILKTTDGGTTWTNQPFPPGVFRGSHALRSVAAANANVAWVVGDCGAALMTTNGGATWNISLGTACRNLNQVVAVDTNTAWATGQGTQVYTMTDGATWTMKYEHTDALYGVGAVNATTAWVAGAGGTILKTTNGGSNWTLQSSGLSGNLWNIEVVDANTAWILTPPGAGAVLKTTNGGATWTAQSTGTSAWLSGLSAVDATTAWAVGENGTILKTTNGGAPVTATQTPTPTPTGTLAATAAPTATTTSAPGTLVWSSIASMSVPRAYVGLAAANGKLYAVGGGTTGDVTLPTVEEYDPSSNSWRSRASMGTARVHFGLATGANGLVYAIGGQGPPGNPFLSSVESYDPTSDTWTPRASLPLPRVHGAAAAASNGKIYLVGGITSCCSETGRLDEYDPATNTWQQRASMPTLRGNVAFVAAPDGKLYAIGGRDDVTGLATVEAYDPATNTWTARASMAQARSYLGGTVLNGLVYAAGGADTGFYASVEEYDPATNAWLGQTPMTSVRSGLGFASLNGKLYAVGGTTQTALLASAEVGQPVLATATPTPTVTSTSTATATATPTASSTPTGTPLPTLTPTPTSATQGVRPSSINWSSIAPMSGPRAAGGLAAAGGKLYSVGGQTAPNVSTTIASVEEYDPATNTWRARASMSVSRATFGLATGPDGLIYAVGGFSWELGILSSVEAYDPATNTWTPRASLPVTRQHHALALASNGKLYAVGGIISCCAETGRVDEYDPATNTWQQRASMPTLRGSVGLIAGPDGKLYAIGGADDTAHVNIVEAYDPATNTWTPRAPLAQTRASVGAAALNGLLYAIGGASNTQYWSSIEEYDPIANTWLPQTSMQSIRAAPGVTTLNGKLYAVGGWDGTGATFASAEVGDPVMATMTPTTTSTPTSTSTATVTATSTATSISTPIPSETPSPTPTSSSTPSPTTAVATSTATSTLTATPTSTVAAVGATRLFLVPTATTRVVGETFTVTVQADAGTSEVDTVDAYLNFDPAKLEVVTATGQLASSVDVNPATGLIATVNAVDNALGHVDLSATKFAGPFPTGAFAVATVRFRAKAATTGAPSSIVIVPTGIRRGDLLRGGVSLAPSLVGADVTISPYVTLSGIIRPEHRGLPGDPKWATPLFRTTSGATTGGVVVYAPGGSTPLGTFVATTDLNGQFSVELTGIVAGTYDLVVKPSNGLSVKRAGVVLPGTTMDFGTFSVGDASGDDAVNGADVSYMVPSFLLCNGEAGFRVYADTNADGCVNGADVSALVPNFLHGGPTSGTVGAPGSGLSGPQAAPGTTSGGAPRGVSTSLQLRASTASASVGDTFSVTFLAHLGAAEADTLDLYLDLDPRLVEPLDAAGRPASALDLDPTIGGTILVNRVDGATGRVDLSVTRLQRPFFTGDVTVGTLRLRARAAGVARLALVRTGPRIADAFSGGQSLNATLTETTVTIAGGAPAPATPTPTPTAGTAPVFRPRVDIRTEATGDGRLRVTATAGCGVIRAVSIGGSAAAMTNASVAVEGGPSGITSARSVALPTPARTVVLYVSRLTPGQPTTVPLTVVDDCGEWQTFVGGGPGAF